MQREQKHLQAQLELKRSKAKARQERSLAHCLAETVVLGQDKSNSLMTSSRPTTSSELVLTENNLLGQ